MYGKSPVAVVFARETGKDLTGLVKQLDKASQDKKFNSFVVFLSDEEKLEGQLKELAKKANLKKTVLTIDNEAGPEGYNISKEAAVTVLLYNKHKVVANHAFTKSDFNQKAVERVIADLGKLSGDE